MGIPLHPGRTNGLPVWAEPASIGAALHRAALPETAFPRTSRDEARHLVERAIEKIPKLTHCGVGITNEREIRFTRGAAFVGEEIARLQQELRRHLRQVAIAADWVKHLDRIKTVCTRLSSDGHKDRVERWCERRGYIESVANGAFIAAAVGLGFTFRVYVPNVCFGFSINSVRDLMRYDQQYEFLFPPWWL
jgi:hypothetical protein